MGLRSDRCPAILAKRQTNPDSKEMTAEPLPQFDAFLSYCHEDQERVRSIQMALERLEVRVWRDTGQIVGGDEWIKNIEAGLS